MRKIFKVIDFLKIGKILLVANFSEMKTFENLCCM